MPGANLLVVGLGNPGPEYAETRHNIGWIVLDSFAEAIGAELEPEPGVQAEVARKRYAGKELCLVKPLSYMNLSGRPVAQMLGREGLEATAMVVVHDDLDLESGRMKLQASRGAGGHNGVEDIIDQLGTKAFTRLRFGIGRPPENYRGRDYVLDPFSADELEGPIGDSIERATSHLKQIAKRGLKAAMNDVNRTERERWREIENDATEPSTEPHQQE